MKLPADTLKETAPVSFTPARPRPGSTVTIHYRGRLAQRLSALVSAHVGYGRNKWRNVRRYPMSRTSPTTFILKYRLTDLHGPLNICFVDDADNWDNNYGQNWQLHY